MLLNLKAPDSVDDTLRAPFPAPSSKKRKDVVNQCLEFVSMTAACKVTSFPVTSVGLQSTHTRDSSLLSLVMLLRLLAFLLLS